MKTYTFADRSKWPDQSVAKGEPVKREVEALARQAKEAVG